MSLKVSPWNYSEVMITAPLHLPPTWTEKQLGPQNGMNTTHCGPIQPSKNLEK
jgi:hypothetical protein